MNKNVDFCTPCCLGKARRLPSTASTTSYSCPLELIFSDLWGPAPVTSFTGSHYYMTFVDAHTRFTWLFLLKNKSEAISTFITFKHGGTAV